MISLVLLLLIVPITVAILGQPPPSTYFDGSDNMNQCATRLERRVTGLSGIVYSHSMYGHYPYNASRNCFMMIVAPAGYRIRLKALEFDVNGDISNCDKDTLHVFDHEEAVDASRPHRMSLDDASIPGPLIGQFCGQINNRSELRASSHNALTLWWHSHPTLPVNHKAAGFKLLWTAFRKSDTGPCLPSREFKCNSEECIPIELACDHYSDCPNGEDLTSSSRSIAKCENIDLDPIIGISGLFVLLVSAAICLLIICLCGAVCYCCKTCKSSEPPTKGVEQPKSMYPPPEPPQFYPPSPPKIPPPLASAYTPKKRVDLDPHLHDGYRTVRVDKLYGCPVDMQNEYAYVKNDVHWNLI